MFIMIDGAVYEFADNSVLGQNHWVALRILDLFLCISVFLQSRKLENLLDEKE